MEEANKEASFRYESLNDVRKEYSKETIFLAKELFKASARTSGIFVDMENKTGDYGISARKLRADITDSLYLLLILMDEFRVDPDEVLEDDKKEDLDRDRIKEFFLKLNKITVYGSKRERKKAASMLVALMNILSSYDEDKDVRNKLESQRLLSNDSKLIYTMSKGEYDNITLQVKSDDESGTVLGNFIRMVDSNV